MLFIIAGIFDPLKLIGLVVFLCKYFMQQLWETKINWHDELPSAILIHRQDLYRNFSLVSKITINRSIKTYNGSNIKFIESHGFADASTKS